jgi:hypothetical protein
MRKNVWLLPIVLALSKVAWECHRRWQIVGNSRMSMLADDQMHCQWWER